MIDLGDSGLWTVGDCNETEALADVAKCSERVVC